MKKILGIVVLGLLLSGNAYAEVEKLPEGTTVNSLIKAGYKLFSTESAATPVTFGDDGRSYTGSFQIIYHLTKGKEVVSCVLYDGELTCVKP
ncbi:hypothetical protein E5R92_00680 [Candidatus Pelagibacter giovannonii]|uniref:Uncharacterized protein n=1 Tax=Candidatus Pelagibacter giovannonii TaxID=2563896 RepID=A0A6H1Q0G7_9PROT|nr:hypothetical protein [Candidatus Pelagibacter giovannonii]QIZ20308.1 hypothetical protein E5R92_00680 [Candidatus Pelagibacter giovannonii]